MDDELQDVEEAINAMYNVAPGDTALQREAYEAIAMAWSAAGAGSFYNLDLDTQRMVCRAMETGYLIARTAG